jgi:hypothetical protein
MVDLHHNQAEELNQFLTDLREQAYEVQLSLQLMHQDHYDSLSLRNAFSAFRMGRAWAGKAKESLGFTSPYKEVDKIQDIPESTDVREKYLPNTNANYDELALANSLRKSIKELVEWLEETSLQEAFSELERTIVLWKEARMELGFYLEELKNG